MNKAVLISVLSLGLTGCSFPFVKQNELSTSSPATPAPIAQFEAASTQIAEAFQSGQPLKCNLTSLEGDQPNSHYLIKDKKMKIESDPAPESSMQFFSLNDGETIYLWSDEVGAPAIKMAVTEVDKNGSRYDNQFQNFPDLSDESTRKDIENSGFTIDCQPAQIDEQEFLPPENIIFTNSTELMKNLMQTEQKASDSASN